MYWNVLEYILEYTRIYWNILGVYCQILSDVLEYTGSYCMLAHLESEEVQHLTDVKVMTEQHVTRHLWEKEE